MANRNDRYPRTSVVLATYNGAAFLHEQLQSLAAQSQKPFEIVISDDGSVDATHRIVQAFARTTDIPIRFHVNQQRLGFADNFLSAAREVGGDLIAFCDQDDVWHPDKIRLCAPHLAKPEVVLAVHRSRLIAENGTVIGTFSQGIDGDRLRPPLSYGPWDVFFGFSMVFRRSLLDVLTSNCRGIDYITGKASLAHDRWVLFVANLVGWTKEIDTELVDYRQHGSNAFGAVWKSGARFDPITTRTNCDLHKQSARHLRDLVNDISERIKDEFSSFDRDKCLEFWNQALMQQEARGDIYGAPTVVKALSQLCQNLLRSTYCNVNDGRLRWQSLAKDLIYVVKARRSLF
jgi:glycosyltransferase involved in cell wall biosynthesis